MFSQLHLQRAALHAACSSCEDRPSAQYSIDQTLQTSSQFQVQGINMTEVYLDAVVKAGISMLLAHDKLVVQCFSLPALEDFAAAQAARGFDIPLVWLVECEAGLPEQRDLERLARLATYTAVGCAPVQSDQIGSVHLKSLAANVSVTTSCCDPVA